jgi:hypothetical protein
VTASDRLTHAQFVARAEVACRAAHAYIASLPLATTRTALLGQLDGLHAHLQTLARAIRALRPPRADAPTVAVLLGGLDDSVAGLERLQAAARRGDRDEIAAEIRAGTEPALRVAQAARKLGLKTCAGI